MDRIPERLGKEPLLEAVWEIRFSGNKSSVADLLPGMIFKAFPNKYGNIVRLPAADIPAPIVERDANLRYLPTIRLENGNQAVQVGRHVVSLSCRRPYSGWSQFSADIRALIAAIRDTGLIGRLERSSLRYIDLFEVRGTVSLSCLNLDLSLGGYEILTRPMQLRAEIQEKDINHIIQVTSPAVVDLPGSDKRLEGVVVDIDSSIVMGEEASWADLEKRLDEIHLACKKMFFSLIRTDMLDSLEPEYGE